MAKYKLQQFVDNKLTDLDLDAKTLDGNGISAFVGNVKITENSTKGDKITITKVDGTTSDITIKNAYRSKNSEYSDFAGESQYSLISSDSEQLGGKNASEYLTGITKDQVTTALGYTPLQSETKRYQHNITLTYSGSIIRFNFINSQSSKYTTFGLLTSDMLSTFGTNIIMAIGQSNKTKILMGISIKKMSEVMIVGMDFQGSNIQDTINSATVTDVVVPI